MHSSKRAAINATVGGSIGVSRQWCSCCIYRRNPSTSEASTSIISRRSVSSSADSPRTPCRGLWPLPRASYPLEGSAESNPRPRERKSIILQPTAAARNSNASPSQISAANIRSQPVVTESVPPTRRLLSRNVVLVGTGRTGREAAV